MSWATLAELVKPKPSARYVVAHAEQDFTSNVPIAALEDEGALIAYEADGEPLTPEHGWPLRLVIPSRYFWKSAKWLRGIELVPSDKPGFWERYGYHNDADYWKEERYEFYARDSLVTALDHVRLVQIDRGRQEERSRPPVDRVERERFLVSDQIGDEPDHEPEKSHGAKHPRNTRSGDGWPPPRADTAFTHLPPPYADLRPNRI